MLSFTQEVETEVIILPLTKTGRSQRLTSQSPKTASSGKNVYGIKYLTARDSSHYSAAILMIYVHQMGVGFQMQFSEYVGPCIE